MTVTEDNKEDERIQTKSERRAETQDKGYYWLPISV